MTSFKSRNYSYFKHLDMNGHSLGLQQSVFSNLIIINIWLWGTQQHVWYCTWQCKSRYDRELKLYSIIIISGTKTYCRKSEFIIINKNSSVFQFQHAAKFDISKLAEIRVDREEHHFKVHISFFIHQCLLTKSTKKKEWMFISVFYRTFSNRRRGRSSDAEITGENVRF